MRSICYGKTAIGMVGSTFGIICVAAMPETDPGRKVFRSVNRGVEPVDCHAAVVAFQRVIIGVFVANHLLIICAETHLPPHGITAKNRTITTRCEVAIPVIAHFFRPVLIMSNEYDQVVITQ